MLHADVIVIGGGHAGCEAASASARLGARTLLITQKRSTIGVMSCNPAIGGLGRGHLVREIDALDGIMARAIDAAGIQFRVLNRSKGAAVRGPRAQADRALYAQAVQTLLAEQNDIEIVEAEIQDLIVEEGRVGGVVDAQGKRWLADAVVLTTGTFLRGIIHLGDQRIPAGRVGDQPAIGLATRLEALDLRMGRMKTGTPPRIDGDSIDFAELQVQDGDDPPEPLSFMTRSITGEQRPCHLSATTSRTHALIRAHLGETPAYAGRISGTGVRYCPSIEDKIVRFPDRERHRIFLEPEGLEDRTVYPNGISMAFEPEIQQEIVATIPGLERARITRPGYAIEYDHVDPRELDQRLAVRSLPGLFLAGQINGSTGYEEAAAQGLIAGANAALAAAGDDGGLVLDRASAYIGVLVDDLTTQGVFEPYRMMTSRAEYRLTLRAGNADRRLTGLGIETGLVRQPRRSAFERKMQAWTHWRQRLDELSATPDEARAHGLAVRGDGRRRSAFTLLSYPENSLRRLGGIWPELSHIPSEITDELETEARYSGYLSRQSAEIASFRKDEALRLPETMPLNDIPGLSNELRSVLERDRPRSIGMASRLPGMTPAGLALLLRHARRQI